jgi:hypothetical protein
MLLLRIAPKPIQATRIRYLLFNILFWDMPQASSILFVHGEKHLFSPAGKGSGAAPPDQGRCQPAPS